jgi:hypothetical protein
MTGAIKRDTSKKELRVVNCRDRGASMVVPSHEFQHRAIEIDQPFMITAR